MAVLGIGPGPQVGRVLKRVHRLVLDDPGMNRRDVLLEWIRVMGDE
jgi:hypothetical protein